MLLQERDNARDQEHSRPNSLQTKINFDQHRGQIRNLVSRCNAFAAWFMVKAIPKDGVIETSKREFEPSMDTILPLFLFVVLRMYTTYDTPIRQVRSPSDLSGQMLKDVKVTRP
jgi:p-aminobenzoyl-glutamate transporter AbgT